MAVFEYILRIKIKNKCENEDDLDLLLKGRNSIRNGIIIPMLLIKLLTRWYIFQLTKYELESVSESIDSDDRNFSFTGLAELFFLTRSQF